MSDITSIFVIGAGNVAQHLASSLAHHVKITGIYSKNGENAKLLSKQLGIKHQSSLFPIPECDLILICTNDDAILLLINELPKDIKIAYTSGSIELPNLDNVGVFYPLQTFSKDRAIDLSKVPFLIETNKDSLKSDLKNLANKISHKVLDANSEERKKIHLAAVFINNFTNHLAFISKDILQKNQLDWELLLPLLNETVSKITDGDPLNVQTGPARRNDTSIIAAHQKLLEEDQLNIYNSITKSIIKTYN